MKIWPEDHADYVKKTYGNLPVREIINGIFSKFGVSYTKNQIIGKAQRLGLARSKAEANDDCARMQKRKVYFNVVKKDGLRFNQLKDGQCQYGVDEGVFCGKDTKGHRNYCPEHQKTCIRRKVRIM